jgi:hypothetical protein
MDKTIHALGVFFSNILANIKISYNAAKGSGERRNVERINWAYTAFAVNNTIPCF